MREFFLLFAHASVLFRSDFLQAPTPTSRCSDRRETPLPQVDVIVHVIAPRWAGESRALDGGPQAPWTERRAAGDTALMRSTQAGSALIRAETLASERAA